MKNALYSGYKDKTKSIFDSLKVSLECIWCDGEKGSVNLEKIAYLDELKLRKVGKYELIIIDHPPKDDKKLKKLLESSKRKTVIVTEIDGLPTQLTPDPSYENVYYIDRTMLAVAISELFDPYEE